MRALEHGSKLMLPRFVLPFPTSKLQQRELREMLYHTANAVFFVTIEENQIDSLKNQRSHTAPGNLWCCLQNQMCGEWRDLTKPYVGETERSLKPRVQKHKRLNSTNSEVSRHINLENPSHSLYLDDVKTIDKDKNVRITVF